MMLGFQACYSPEASCDFFRFFSSIRPRESDRPTQYQETHSTQNDGLIKVPNGRKRKAKSIFRAIKQLI